MPTHLEERRGEAETHLNHESVDATTARPQGQRRQEATIDTIAQLLKGTKRGHVRPGCIVLDADQRDWATPD
jgi:hypothetical protein